MQNTRFDPGRIRFSDTELWILGGREHNNDWLQSTELCSPYTGCTYFVDFPELAEWPEAVRINSSHIFIKTNINRRAWIFNQNDNSFQQLPDMSLDRNRASLGMVNGHDIVVAGGISTTSTEIFDLNINQWRQGPDLPDVVVGNFRFCCARNVQYQDSFLIVGGTGSSGGLIDTIMTLNPQTYEWDILPQRMTNATTFPGVILVPDNYVTCS